MRNIFTLRSIIIFFLVLLIIITACFLIVFIFITILYAFHIPPYLIEKVNWLIYGDTTNFDKSRTLTFLGAIVAGLIAILTLILSFRRYNQTDKIHKETQDKIQKQIKLTEENNLNTTFKDAVLLLGNTNVSVRMGGVYTLVDIAKNQSTYTKRINNILCNYIVSQTELEAKKEEYDNRHIQELINYILIENNDIFKDKDGEYYTKDFSYADFRNIQFFRATLINCNFSSANLENCYFYYANLTNCNFFRAILTNCNFLEGTLTNCNLLFTKHYSLGFKKTILNYCTIEGSLELKKRDNKIYFIKDCKIENCRITDYFIKELIFNNMEINNTAIRIKKENTYTFSFSDSVKLHNVAFSNHKKEEIIEILKKANSKYNGDTIFDNIVDFEKVVPKYGFQEYKDNIN